MLSNQPVPGGEPDLLAYAKEVVESVFNDLHDARELEASFQLRDTGQPALQAMGDTAGQADLEQETVYDWHKNAQDWDESILSPQDEGAWKRRRMGRVAIFSAINTGAGLAVIGLTQTERGQDIAEMSLSVGAKIGIGYLALCGVVSTMFGTVYGVVSLRERLARRRQTRSTE